jgi:DNA-binding MurR/RpiR family transcriptional regulator
MVRQDAPSSTMTSSIAERLRDGFPNLTKSEKAVASYMLAHLNSLPYETAASIAESAGVSSMTVSRFLRGLGYNGLGELKEHLRTEPDATPLLISDRLARIRKASRRGDKLWDNFELEMQATLGVYELLAGPLWKRVVETLSTSSNVFVTGFQTISGIASDFAARLDYLRPNVRFLDGRNGTFSELLADGGASPCLTLFEMRRYTKTSLRLAEAAQQSGIPLVIVSDSHCYWARDYTDLVLSVRTQSHLFWDNQAPFLTLNNLLLDAIITKLGDSVEPRLGKLRDLQDKFEAFHD